MHKICSVQNCNTKVITKSDKCSVHKKRKTCSEEGCQSQSAHKGKCEKHSNYQRQRKCELEGCDIIVVRGKKCETHSENKLCEEEGCTKYTKFGKCSIHISRPKCSEENCDNISIIGMSGKCNIHKRKRKYKICSEPNCSKPQKVNDKCLIHCTKQTCTEEGCKNKSSFKHGKCGKHKHPRKTCVIEGCKTMSTKYGKCSKHQDNKNKCSETDCVVAAQTNGKCIYHNGYKRKICVEEGCTNIARIAGKCRKHGGMKVCSVDNCNSPVDRNNKCFSHIDKTTCVTENCTSIAYYSGHCYRHYPDKKRCDIDSCSNYSIDSSGKCWRHGGGKRKYCRVEECGNLAVNGFKNCIRHGGGKKCSIPECDTMAHHGGLCVRHGGGVKCSVDGCNTAKTGGYETCGKHGANKCVYDNCTKYAVYEKLCAEHHPAYLCPNCKVMWASVRGGICSGPGCGGQFRSKEYQMVEFITSQLPEYNFIWNQTIESQCSRYRPDLRLELDDRMIIIECDENEHISYKCDIPRMLNIHQETALPTIFIRWNPDKLSRKNDTFENRLKRLLETIETYINIAVQHIPVAYPLVDYLFYNKKKVTEATNHFNEQVAKLYNVEDICLL